MRRRPVALAAVLAALAAPGLALARTVPTPAPGPAPAPTSTPTGTPTQAPLAISVSATPTTAPRPADFLGLALEYSTIPQWVDDQGFAPGVDPVLVQLIRNLDPTGDSVLRVGGQSGDRTWWPVPGLAAPIGVTSALGPSWTAAAHALAVAVDARYLLGINLEADSSAVAGYEARNLVAGVGRPYVRALELGNEADLYRRTPWYEVLNGQPAPWYIRTGTPVWSRSPGFGPHEFVDEIARAESALPAGLPLAGPDAADADWIGTFEQLAQQPGRVGLLDSHAYALQQCDHDPASPRYPSIPHLLALRASRDILHGVEPFVASAHADHIPFRIDELGSVTCNGRLGVSDTMASALWVTDALFTAVDGGVDGVNLHTFPDSSNGLFDLAFANGAWSTTVHPIYDGTIMFADADPPGARLLRLTAGDQRQVRSWATLGADGRVRVMLINVGGVRQVTVRPELARAAGPASLVQMLAPGVAATSGVTIGGQSFTRAGVLPAAKPSSVSPTHGGYALALPTDSETLLTVSPTPSRGRRRR